MIPPLFGVGETLYYMMLTLSMSLKVKVPNERMRPTSNEAYKEMNDTEGVRIGYSRGELDSGNDIRLFMIIEHQTR